MGPFNRWIAGLVMLLTVYFVYGGTSHMVETDLPAAATTLSTNQYGMEIISNIVGNYWWGTLLFVLAGLILLFMAGIPGQQEETRYE